MVDTPPDRPRDIPLSERTIAGYISRATATDDSNRVDAPQDANEPINSPKLKYNLGPIRRSPIVSDLERKIKVAVRDVYGPGYTVSVYSGGQPTAKEAKKISAETGKRVKDLRTGSTRHDDGRAADIYVKDPNGKVVRGEALAKLGQYWAAAGLGGIGLEMARGGIHVDLHSGHWNYAGKEGGTYSKAQKARMKEGLKGVLPSLYDNDFRQTPQDIAASKLTISRNPFDTPQAPAQRTPAPTFQLGDRVITDTPNTVGAGVNSMLGAIGNFASNVYNKAKDATPTPPQGVPTSPLDRLRSMNISRNAFDTQQGAKAPVSPVQSAPLAAPVSNPSAPGAAALSKLRSMAEPQGDMRASPFDMSAGTYAIGGDNYSRQMEAQRRNANYSVTGGQAPQAATPARAVTPRETVRALGRATMDPGFTTSDMARRTPVSVPSSPMSQPAKTAESSYTPNYAMKSLGPGPTAPKAPTPSLGTVAGNLAGGLSKVAGYATTGAAKAFTPKPKAAPSSPPPVPKAIPSSISGFAGNIAGVTGGILGKVGAGALGGLSSLGSLTPAGQAALNAQIAKAQAMLAAPQPVTRKPPMNFATPPRRVVAPVQPAMPVASLASLVPGGDVRANTPNAPQRIGTAPSGAGLYSFGQDINGVKQVFNTATPSNAFGAMGYGNPFSGMLGGFGGGGPSKSSDNKGQSKSDSGGGWGAGSSRPTGGGAGGGLKSGPYGK